MYQGKRRIMNPERHEEYRSQAISFRGGAITILPLFKQVQCCS